MRSLSRTLVLVLAIGGVGLLIPDATHAYGGPGSIVSGIGALLAAVAAIAAAIFGFFWFPLKRLFRKLRGDGEEGGEVASGAGGRAAEEFPSE